MPAYEFTADWFTHCSSVWEELLGPLVGRPELKALEIGSHEGRSALWLLENVLTHSSSAITCIDPWYDPDVEGRFDRNIAASGRGYQVRKIKAASQRTLTNLPERSFDVAYIDGSHEAADVLLDGLLTVSLVKVGGLLIFDDYLWSPPPQTLHHPPRPGIDAFLQLCDWRLTEVHRGWQIAVRVIA